MTAPTFFFLDGVAPTADSLAIAAQYNAHPDAEMSVVLLKLGAAWSSVRFDDDVICSTAFDEHTGTLYMLGTSGAVHTIGGREPAFNVAAIRKTRQTTQLVDPEERGALTRVRVVRGRVIVCGLGGQVLERRDGTWVNIGLGGDVTSTPDFEDVTVTADGVPLAVGAIGAIYRFAAEGPQRLDGSVSHHLSTVITDARGRTFACGNEGTVLRLDGPAVTQLSVDVGPVRHLWSLVIANDRLYACEPRRLLTRTLDSAWTVASVSHALEPTFHRLSASGGALWSFGPDHVFAQRDGTWSQELIPGNELPL